MLFLLLITVLVMAMIENKHSFPRRNYTGIKFTKHKTDDKRARTGVQTLSESCTILNELMVFAIFWLPFVSRYTVLFFSSFTRRILVLSLTVFHTVLQQTIVSRVFNLSPTQTLAFSLVALSYRGGFCCCCCCY